MEELEVNHARLLNLTEESRDQRPFWNDRYCTGRKPDGKFSMMLEKRNPKVCAYLYGEGQYVMLAVTYKNGKSTCLVVCRQDIKEDSEVDSDDSEEDIGGGYEEIDDALYGLQIIDDVVFVKRGKEEEDQQGGYEEDFVKFLVPGGKLRDLNVHPRRSSLEGWLMYNGLVFNTCTSKEHVLQVVTSDVETINVSEDTEMYHVYEDPRNPRYALGYGCGMSWEWNVPMYVVDLKTREILSIFSPDKMVLVGISEGKLGC